MIFLTTKNGWTTKKFPPPLLVLLLDPGSGIDKNQDPKAAYGMCGKVGTSGTGTLYLRGFFLHRMRKLIEMKKFGLFCF